MSEVAELLRTAANFNWETAQRLAALGWRVLPCDGSKQPLIRGSVQGATTDQGVIARWWTQLPWANPAVAADNCLIIDCDAGSEAWSGREDVAAALLGAGAIVRTPKRVRHYYFRLPDGAKFTNAVKVLLGVDVRTTGGYALVPLGDTKDGSCCWIVELAVGPEQLPPLPDVLRRELERAERNGRHVNS